MTEFNISRGLSTVLFTPEGQVNQNLVIEEGGWYLCTDTAELFLGVQTEEGLSLVQINDVERHPVITEVKTKVENVLIPKVEEEIVPTIEEVKSTTEELKAWVDNKEFLQHIDLEGYATEEFVTEAISGIKVQASDIYKVDFNAPNFTEALEAYNSGKVLVLINAAPDVNSYAVMNYVSDKYITFTKFLMSRSEAYGAFNTYYLGVDNTWEVAKEVKLNKVEANVEGEITGELSTVRIGKEIYKIPTGGSDINLGDYYTKEEVNELIPDVYELATKEALQTVATDVDALAITTTKERYEVIRVPGLEVIHRDDEIRLNTEHVDLTPQNVGDGGESNAYYVGIKIYAPANAESIRQNVTSTPGIQEGKEIVPFTITDVDSYGRKYSTIWVKCAVYQNGAWLNYGMNSTSAKCLGYYYSVEWYDNNGNVIENDSIHVVFTNDTCHYSNISDAVSRRFITVEEAIAAINIPETDLSNYYNKSEVDALIPNISNLVTSEQFEVVQQQSAGNNVKILQLDEELIDVNQRIDNIDLTPYATKEEVTAVEEKIPSTEGLATKQELDDAIAAIEHPTVDLEGYATENYVDTKFAEIKVPTAVSELNNDAGYITANDIPEVNLSNYYTKSETETLVNEAVNGIEIPDTTGFITMGDVEAKGYLTSDDIADKADKSELASLATKEEVEAVEGKIPSLENYATKQDVADAVAGIEIPEVPEVNLENYHTKAEITELLGVKANEVPFKTAKFVTHAIGDFVSGDNVIDLTIAQLFAKLLGLVDEPGETPEEPDEPVEPDVPEEFDSVAEKINTTQLPMYSVTSEGDLVPVAFKLVDKDAEPTESGFYAVKDTEGNIIQAGYQDLTTDNDEMYYAIALPKEVDYDTAVTLYSWDPDDKVWVDSEMPGFTSDPDVVAELCGEAGIDISHIDTEAYTVWVLPDVCTGSILRYEFKEELL